MKYSIEEIRDIADKAKVKVDAKTRSWFDKREKKRDKQTVNLLKKLNRLIVKSAKKGLTSCVYDVKYITERQKDIILDYFEFRLYKIRIDKYNTFLIDISWKRKQGE